MKFSTKTKAIWNGMEFTHGVRRALTLALALIYFVQLGFNVIWISTLFAVASILGMFFEFPTGAVADYDSRKKSLMISFCLFSIAFFGIYFVNNFWLIAGFWILSEIAWTFSTGAGSACVIDALGIAKKKSKIVKLISRGYIFEKSGRIIGGFIGFVIIAINFRLIWFVAGLMSLVMFFVIWKYMEERNFKPEKVSHNYLKKSWIKAVESFNFIIHKKNSNLRVLMLTSTLSTVGYSIFYFSIPLFFTQVMGMGAEFFSGLLGVMAFVCLGSPLIAERIAKAKGFRRSLLITSIISGLAIIALAVSSLLAIAIFFFAVLEIIGTVLDVLDESASHHEYDSKIRASLQSVWHITWDISNSIGVFLAGVWIVMFGIVPTLIISGGIIFLTAFGYLLMKE